MFISLAILSFYLRYVPPCTSCLEVRSTTVDTIPLSHLLDSFCVHRHVHRTLYTRIGPTSPVPLGHRRHPRAAPAAAGGASPYTVIVRYAARTLASMGESIDTLVAHDGDSEHTKCTKERAAPMVRISFGQPCGVAATYLGERRLQCTASYRCSKFENQAATSPLNQMEYAIEEAIPEHSACCCVLGSAQCSLSRLGSCVLTSVL